MSKPITAVAVERKMTTREAADFHLRMLGKPFGAWHKRRKPPKRRLSGGGVSSFVGECCTLPRVKEPSLAWRAASGLSRPCLECGKAHDNGNAFCSSDCCRDWKSRN